MGAERRQLIREVIDGQRGSLGQLPTTKHLAEQIDWALDEDYASLRSSIFAEVEEALLGGSADRPFGALSGLRARGAARATLASLKEEG